MPLATPYSDRANAGVLVPESTDVQVGSAAEAFEIYFEMVWRNLRRLGVETASVDDAVQDVFLVVHRRLPEFEGRSQFKTWLFGIVLKVASNYRRKKRPEGETALEPASPSDDPERLLQRREAGERLNEALGALKPQERELFVLVELSQLTVPEAAAALSIPLNTAYGRLRHARASFEEILKRQRCREEHTTATARRVNGAPSQTESNDV